MENNFFNFSNQRLKVYMSEILQNRYSKHDQILERIGSSLSLDRDMRAFADLIVEVYDLGYVRAITDYEKEINKLGYNVKIVPPEKPKESTKIFK